jgi:DNA-binding PucR family transcriptional regulator
LFIPHSPGPPPAGAGPAPDLHRDGALAGAAEAGRALRYQVYGALERTGGELLETLDAFFAASGVLESAARALYVHPNTVRYRLKRVAEVTGFTPANARDGFTLRLALTLGRLEPPSSPHT